MFKTMEQFRFIHRHHVMAKVKNRRRHEAGSDSPPNQLRPLWAFPMPRCKMSPG